LNEPKVSEAKYKLFSKFILRFLPWLLECKIYFAVVIGVQNLFCCGYWSAKFILQDFRSCYFATIKIDNDFFLEASFAYRLGISVLYSSGKRYNHSMIYWS